MSLDYTQRQRNVQVRVPPSLTHPSPNQLTNPQKRKQDFVPPKKPYSFLAMLDDILQFSAQTLVDNGRLSFWMPTSNDQDQEIGVPTHPYLEIVCVATQVFNKCIHPSPCSSNQQQPPNILLTTNRVKTSNNLQTHPRLPSRPRGRQKGQRRSRRDEKESRKDGG